MLLQTGNQNVSEVAYAIGFENVPYFTRSFKKEFGVTPSQARTKSAIVWAFCINTSLKFASTFEEKFKHYEATDYFNSLMR